MKKNKSSRLLETIYETASDLHGCGLLTDHEIQAYQEIAPLEISVKLDNDVAYYLKEKCADYTDKLQVLINDLLRKNIEIAKRVSI